MKTNRPTEPQTDRSRKDAITSGQPMKTEHRADRKKDEVTSEQPIKTNRTTEPQTDKAPKKTQSRHHLFVGSAVSEVGHDATRFRLVATVARVHGPQHVEVGQTLPCVLPRLHLAVHHSGILPLPVYVMHLRHIARFLHQTDIFIIIIIMDHFCIPQFSALKQTWCVHVTSGSE